MAAVVLLSSCQSDVEDVIVALDSDLVEVSLGMVGEFIAEDAVLTRAAHSFEYYVAISADAVTDGNISTGYVGRFSSLTDATVSLKKGTTYNFYISAFESAGATADLSTICATQGEFIEVSSATPFAPEFADTKVDRYYGSTTEEIITNTTVSISGKRFAYGINVNIETPLEGKVVMSSESPAFTYTVTSTDDAKVENNIFCLAGVDEEESKTTTVTVKLYNASNVEVSSAEKTLTIARNHMKTLKVKALDPKAGFDFSISEEDMEDDGEEIVEISEVIEEEDPFNGFDYVDLGITDKNGKTLYWATCNVGASSPEMVGNHYAFGYSQITACTEDSYNGSHSYEDAASVVMGGNWRTPTKAELDKLVKLNYETKVVNGRQCWIFKTSDNSKSITMPVTGNRYNSNVLNETIGYYWSSTRNAGNTKSYCMSFSENSQPTVGESLQYFGFAVRAVCVIE